MLPARLVIAVSLLAAAACEPAPSNFVDAGPTGCEGSEPEDATFAQAMAVVRGHAAEAIVPGIAFATVRGGEVEHVGVFGTKVGTHCAPITEDTRFLTFAGMHFTAAAVMSAATDGLLDLSAPITDAVPEFSLDAPADPTAVTLHHLLSNTASIGRELITGCFGLGEWFSVYDAMPQWTPAGEIYLWAPINTTIAAQALASANESSFEDAMAEHLFDAAGIEAIYDPVWARKGDHAIGHRHGEINGVLPLPISEGRCTSKEPYQGMFASIRDFARLLEVLTSTAEGDALLAPVAEAFWAPDQATYSGLTRGPYAVDTDVLAMNVHALGYGYAIRIAPDEGFAIAVLVNANHGRAGDLADALVRVYTGLEPGYAGAVPTGEELADLAGVYRDPFAMREMTITIVDGALMAELSDFEDAFELTPARRYADEDAGLARDVFELAISDNDVHYVRFWRDEAGIGVIASEETIRSALGPPMLRRQ